jgi:hypothetical protein
LNETGWKDSGTITFDEGKFLYLGGSFQERGVGMLLNAETSKCLYDFWTVSDRVLLVKLSRKPFNISIIQVNAPTLKNYAMTNVVTVFITQTVGMVNRIGCAIGCSLFLLFAISQL